MKWFYCNHDSTGNMKRLWREDWAGDQFDKLGKLEFAQRVSYLISNGNTVEEYNDDQDNDTN